MISAACARIEHTDLFYELHLAGSCPMALHVLHFFVLPDVAVAVAAAYY